jgi:signal transduction histidine kinase
MGQAVDHRKQAATATQQSVFDLAHEIRNPLAGIKGVADTFLRNGQLTRQEREWMEAVRREVSKIDARLRELLATSQTRVFHAEQCSLNDLISGVVLLASHQVNSINDHHGRQISIEFIDATSEPILVDLDPARIDDVVLNLVLNAIESIQGDGRVTVRLRRAIKPQGDDEALIEVSDTGCGIPHEHRRRIFDPLFTTKPDGTGLGLAAVRRTAAAYHGRISFKTRLGRGSKFVFALPLRSQSGESCA